MSAPSGAPSQRKELRSRQGRAVQQAERRSRKRYGRQTASADETRHISFRKTRTETRLVVRPTGFFVLFIQSSISFIRCAQIRQGREYEVALLRNPRARLIKTNPSLHGERRVFFVPGAVYPSGKIPDISTVSLTTRFFIRRINLNAQIQRIEC